MLSLMVFIFDFFFFPHGHKMAARAPDDVPFAGRKKDVGGAEDFSEYFLPQKTPASLTLARIGPHGHS